MGGLPSRYRGIAADKRAMIVLGKKQVLRVKKLVDCFSPVVSSRIDSGVAKLQVYHNVGLREYCHCELGASACIGTPIF